MDEHPDAERLAAAPLFEDLSEEQVQKLAVWFEPREYDAGNVPLHHDQHGYVFYVIDDGSAHAEIDGQVLTRLGPGDYFGEMAFFADDGRRTADVIADTSLRVWAVFGTSFREMQLALPDVAARLVETARERFDRMRS